MYCQYGIKTKQSIDKILKDIWNIFLTTSLSVLLLRDIDMLIYKWYFFSKMHLMSILFLAGLLLNLCFFFSSFSDVQTTNGILGADGISNLVSSQEYNVIRLAFALTVPGMFVLCLGVNFLCYKMYVLSNRFWKLWLNFGLVTNFKTIIKFNASIKKKLNHCINCIWYSFVNFLNELF